MRERMREREKERERERTLNPTCKNSTINQLSCVGTYGSQTRKDNQQFFRNKYSVQTRVKKMFRGQG
jgi:hypothetical protein